MRTQVLRSPTRRHAHLRVDLSAHWTWLAIGFVVAFAAPLLLADVMKIHRHLFYGLYTAAVLGLVGLWARATGYDLRGAIRRRWPWAVGLGVLCGAVLAVMVVRTETATARPEGIKTGRSSVLARGRLRRDRWAAAVGVPVRGFKMSGSLRHARGCAGFGAALP